MSEHDPSSLVSSSLVSQERANCRFGVWCREHGFIHGAEAEELRCRLEKILAVDGGSAKVSIQLIRQMLDDVDARDSLAWLEHAGQALSASPAPAVPPEEGRPATDAEFQASASRVLEKHSHALNRLASSAVPPERARLQASTTNALRLIRNALEAAYTGSREHGAFFREARGEYVPSPFMALDDLEAALGAGEPPQPNVLTTIRQHLTAVEIAWRTLPPVPSVE